MNVLIFNGTMDSSPYTTANQLTGYFVEQFRQKGFSTEVFSPVDGHIPFFAYPKGDMPDSVKHMCEVFLKADVHVWLTPLYHGSMTGVMKNTLDWLEMTSKLSNPYLTGKVVALVCWGDGSQAMQGINAMDSVAKALRAWVLPFSVPIMKEHLYDAETKTFTASYKNKFDRMVSLLGDSKIGDKKPVPDTGGNI
jgi:arsenic resistance protein ArsH